MKRSLIKNRLNNSVCCLAMLLLGLTAGSALATTYNVATVANGGSDTTGDGSLGKPYATIAKAVTACSAGDTVSIGTGTYILSAGISVSGATKNNLTIRGTSGNPADVIVDGNNNASGCFNLATNVTLQYLTIQHGTYPSYGAAIYISGGTSVTVRACNIFNNGGSGAGGNAIRMGSANCFFTMDSCNISSNVAGVLYTSVAGAVSCLFTQCTFSYNNVAGSGGGIFLNPTLHLPTITTCAVYNCTFISNTNNAIGTGGGGPAINLASNVVGLINNCAFIANRTTYDGGAITIFNGTISNCGFTNNWARAGGAVLLNAGSPLGVGATVSSCSFVGNSTFTYGGGAVSYYDGIVSNCVLAGNFTTGLSAGGGAISTALGPAPKLIAGCTFSNNSCNNPLLTSAYGGGGIYLAPSVTGTVQNCLFVGNYTVTNSGGAIATDANNLSTPWTIRNCGFFGNQAYSAGVAYGGGLFLRGSNTVVDSCTFVANSCHSGGGAVYASTSASGFTFTNCIVYSNLANGVTNEISFGAAITGTFQNCCIASTNKYGGASVTFNNCFTNYPQFRNAGTGYGTNLLLGAYDFRLQKGSLCIDNGLTEPWMNVAGATDQTGANQTGNPRVFGTSVDIGCYEYTPGLALGTSIYFR